MSDNYNIATLNARLQQVANAIDAGPSNGFMKLLAAGGNVLSSLQLARPSGSVTGGVMTLNSLPLMDPAAPGSGIAKAARFEDSTGNVVISGLTVAANGNVADILLSPSNAITAGQAVAVSAATITGN